MTTPSIPDSDKLWIGQVHGCWPVHLFVAKEHVMFWLGAGEPQERRRAWEVKIEVGQEVILHRAVEQLVPLED